MSINTSKISKRLFRLSFYLNYGLQSLKPHRIAQQQLTRLMNNFHSLPAPEQSDILKRVNYYHKLSEPFDMVMNSTQIKNFHLKGHNSSYFLDLAALLPHFPNNNYFSYEFGDVTHVPKYPALVKSRPIKSNNHNAILLKLDSVRHFHIPKDTYRYEEKKPKIVWRGAAHQAHRIRLLENHANNTTSFDLGCVAASSLGKAYHAEYLSIAEQQQYQFILSIEGNDVATNLKWIMASNSVCFMTKPRYETWFMEGSLIPGYHYVQLQDDYSDLTEKVSYYQENPIEAKKIIQQAQTHVCQFFNKDRERLIQLLVLKKYFELTNQSLTK